MFCARATEASAGTGTSSVIASHRTIQYSIFAFLERSLVPSYHHASSPIAVFTSPINSTASIRSQLLRQPSTSYLCLKSGCASMDVPSDPPELSATHPLLSLIAAVFWALRELLGISLSSVLIIFLFSVASVMGQVSHCLRNNLRTTLYLCCSVILPDIHCESDIDYVLFIHDIELFQHSLTFGLL